MVENLNWESFGEKYHLKNDKYVQDVILLQRLQSDKRYPIILYPQLLREQLSKKFMIGSVGVALKDKNHIYLHDFLNVAKSLNLKMQQSHQYPKFPQKEQNFTKHVIGDVSFLLL